MSAADAVVAAGRPDLAPEYLQLAVWLADRDPASARVAVRRLRELDDRWSERRVVAVHVYADESLRAHVGWRFRLRTLLLGVSKALGEILDTQFVPMSIQAFRSAGASDDLIAIDAAFSRRSQQNRNPGIRAAFTERPMPQRRGVRRKGLGRVSRTSSHRAPQARERGQPRAGPTKSCTCMAPGTW